MPAARFNMYWQAIDMLEARDIILACQVGVYPDLKAQAKKKFIEKVRKVAYPDGTAKTTKQVSPAELAAWMGPRVK